jgi:hypothetical protein
MIVLNELDWVKKEPEFIGPHDEGEDFFNHLCAAARAGAALWKEEAYAVAKIAYALQVDSIVWIYEAQDQHYIEEFGLPSINDAELKMGQLTESGSPLWIWPDYGTKQAKEFATWVMENQAEDWREKEYERRLENQLAQMKADRNGRDN